MLVSHIKATYGFHPESPEFGVVLKAAVAHFTGACTAHEMQHQMKPVLTRRMVSAQKFRLDLSSNRYMLSNLRYYGVRLAIARSVNMDTVRALRNELQVDDEDAYWVSVWFLADDDFRRSMKTNARRIDPSKLSFREVDRQLSAVWPKFEKYLKYTVWNKLRFLFKAENSQSSDLEMLLLEEILPKFVMRAPFETDLHALNFLKSYATARVHNVRNKFNAKKRRRMLDHGLDKNGMRINTMLTLSENQLNAHAEDGSEIGIDSLASTDLTGFELKFSVQQLLDKIRDPRKVRLVHLLMGFTNPAFTRWLQTNALAKRSEDNADVQNRVEPNVFLGYVAKWLGITVKAVNKFMDRMKFTLGGQHALA